ncbi:MAG: GNAT family N-acetyltransferase [Chloroflexota bacterium]
MEAETDLPTLRALGDESLVTAFSRLIVHFGSSVGGSRTFGGATAIVSGMPPAFFNPILGIGETLEPDDIRLAVAWCRDRGVRPSLQIRDDLEAGIAGIARDLGFERESWPMPGMALWLASMPPAELPPELQLRVVETAGDLEDWHAVFGSGPAYRQAFGPRMLEDREIRLLTGSVDGKPVTAAAAFHTPRVVGIYSVATAENARRHGYGRAVTRAAIDAGRATWGSEVAILQSSEMGFPIYRAMGFAAFCRYAIYVEPLTEEPA